MNITGFSDLTLEDLRATSVVFNPTKEVHTKKPSAEPTVPAGHQKPGQDIWDWLGVTKPNKKGKDEDPA